ncbi:MAG: hypothetical protein NTW28_38105 [Candidatus Solibacter sp.]|nr:hypothetical protein [Candidatus Solibacter sp.]
MGIVWHRRWNRFWVREQPVQRVNYSIDSNPLNGGYSQNVWGRVTAQRMDYNNNDHRFDAAYTWDNEGRMTGTNYGPQYTFQYAANDRLGGMSGSDLTMTASYGVAGEMTGLSYGGYSETRTYNALLQLTRTTVTGMMDMQYVYAAGANNGRITQATDWVAGETVNYTYDALNRLAAAGATNGTWGQAFTYDGFGNLTGKTATAGSPPTMSASFDPATNRVVGGTYDANGNSTAAGWVYDVENRLIAGAGGTYTYYGIGGQKLATLACEGPNNGCAPVEYNVYFGGKLVKSKGVVVVTDRLGSVRASGTERMTYYPYGEERTTTADGREKFGT